MDPVAAARVKRTNIPQRIGSSDVHRTLTKEKTTVCHLLSARGNETLIKSKSKRAEGQTGLHAAVCGAHGLTTTGTSPQHPSNVPDLTINAIPIEMKGMEKLPPAALILLSVTNPRISSRDRAT
jgi:hypothetical protein